MTENTQSYIDWIDSSGSYFDKKSNRKQDRKHSTYTHTEFIVYTTDGQGSNILNSVD